MYRVVGADNQEYGPISAETLKEWIAQGRANSETLARYEDGGAWKPLRTFDEFREALGLPQGVEILPPPSRSISGFAAGKKSNLLATLGLILSTVGCCCPLAGPFLGILLSSIALAQISARPADYTTSPAVAKAGIIFGVVFLTLHLWVVFG